MTEMIDYCGYNCHLCVARSDDPALRQQLVDGWRKFFGYENYTAENVRCDGCRCEGPGYLARGDRDPGGHARGANVSGPPSYSEKF
ncbi:MAG: DUF3795 domain-containing protein [Chloroflexi bacterium]|nr:DUF3795 domain-containing protein [Chloroflexota bacterium]MBU1749468.1 DUF3795 domain-containing protein [Chloroflexota bacterium]